MNSFLDILGFQWGDIEHAVGYITKIRSAESFVTNQL